MPIYDWDAFIDEAATVIKDTWTDVVVEGIWEDDEIARETWEERDFPYAVFEMSEAEPTDEYGLTNEAYKWTFTAHYICDEADGKAAVRAKLEALKSAMRATYFTVSQATLLDSRQDWTANSKINSTFIGRNAPFMSGSISFDFVGGTTYR